MGLDLMAPARCRLAQGRMVCGLNIHSLRTLERTWRTGCWVHNVLDRTPFGLKDFSPPTHAMAWRIADPMLGCCDSSAKMVALVHYVLDLSAGEGASRRQVADDMMLGSLRARARRPIPAVWGALILLFPVARRVRY